jgi:phosphoglycolate phosphatase
MRKAVIFDFDGTLADSLEAVRRIFNRLAGEFGVREVSAGEVPALRHLNLRSLLKTLEVKKRHLPSILRRGKAMLREEMPNLGPCPGVLEELATVRANAVRCGILTSNSVENVEVFLQRFGVRDHFDFIESCRKLKGKAKYLRAIARNHSLKPSEMLYVGDEVRDVKACRKAGVPVVAVTWGFNSAEALAESKPAWMVDEARSLAKLIANA